MSLPAEIINCIYNFYIKYKYLKYLLKILMKFFYLLINNLELISKKSKEIFNCICYNIRSLYFIYHIIMVYILIQKIHEKK